VPSVKISDTSGVQSVDIGNGQVKTEDLANGVIQLKIHGLQGSIKEIPPGCNGFATVHCPSGEKVTGGGFFIETGAEVVQVLRNEQSDENSWLVSVRNHGTVSRSTNSRIRHWHCCWICPTTS
jgi:hypothetical protein